MHVPRSGVTYSRELEWIMAAVWANYKPDETDFFALDGERQSTIVAAYRTHNQIEAVIAYEQVKEARRNAKKKGKK